MLKVGDVGMALQVTNQAATAEELAAAKKKSDADAARAAMLMAQVGARIHEQWLFAWLCPCVVG